MSPQDHLSTPNHLSDEALDDLLIGAGSSSDLTHLHCCATCTARLAEFRASMAVFNQASATWSQARSNTISRVLTPRRKSTGPAAAWSLASAAVLSVALTFMFGVHRDISSPVSQPPHGDQTELRDQEIASDNAMLHAIDSELSEPVPSPVEVSSAQKAIRSGLTREVRN